MNEYKKKVKRSLVYYICAVVLAAITVAVLSILSLSMETEDSTFFDGLVKGLGVGMFAGFALIFVTAAVKCGVDLKSDEKLRARQIAENDERYKMIRERAGGTGYNIAMGGLALASIAATYFDNTVAITLMCALVFVTLIKGSLKVYYMKKY